MHGERESVCFRLWSCRHFTSDASQVRSPHASYGTSIVARAGYSKKWSSAHSQVTQQTLACPPIQAATATVPVLQYPAPAVLAKHSCKPLKVMMAPDS